ncbi:MAG: GNAT family N-acetyltransferase [Cytophagales bacterium]|nr:GNAT family N-acetyltransferase [Cytophagales bacterium]
MILFESPRLLIRRLRADDLLAFHRMQANANVMKFTLGSPQPFERNLKELENHIKSYREKMPAEKVWAIEKKSDSQFIGTCRLVRNEEEENEIAYCFDEVYWGHGYGSELAHRLIEYCLDELQLDDIVAYVTSENIASIRIMEKSVMQFEKRITSEIFDSVELKYSASLHEQKINEIPSYCSK